MSNGQMTKSDAIEGRIDRQVAGSIGISSKNGLAVGSLGEAMEIAKLMSVSREAVPRHLRDNPGACLALCIQGYEWSINPFALANKSYVVNDRLSYEASLYQAVVTRRAPIKGRIKLAYEGEGMTRSCKVWAVLSDGSEEIVEYTSPKFKDINPKNSPLWKNDPDQQLFYFSVRSFARRHFPDVMMGVYTVDEMQDSPPDSIVYTPTPAAAPAESRAAQVLKKVTGKVIDAPAPAPQAETPAEVVQPEETVDTNTGEVTTQEAETVEPEQPAPASEPKQEQPKESPAPKPMTLLEEFHIALSETGESLGVEPSKQGQWWRGYILQKGFKGKEDKMKQADLTAALVAFAAAYKQQ